MATKQLTKEEVRKVTHGIPRTRYPWTLETYYARQLRRMVAQWKAIAADALQRTINPQVRGGNNVLHDDDNDNSNDIALAIAIMVVSINGSTSDAAIASIATKFVNSVDSFSYSNTQAQAHHVGIDVVRTNTTIDAYTNMKIKENVALIKSMRSDFVDGLEKRIYHSINSGDGIKGIASYLTQTAQMANNKAALIANDQTGSILGQLDGYRAKRAGAKGYVWQSMEDDRVRPRHRNLDQTFQYYDDPEGGDNGMMPGEPIRCRCIALPSFDI